MTPKTYTSKQYDEAQAEAETTSSPLWDTHQNPDRYVVGSLSVEQEEDTDNADWTQLQ